MTDYRPAPKSIVDELAQFIRQVDGNNKMGAGSLADKICERFCVGETAVQGGPVGFCEDAALALAERTFSTEVDEQLAEDVVQYASHLHSRYLVNQQAADSELVRLRKRVMELEDALNDQLNDCINFDGGKLTDIIMEKSTAILRGG